MARITYPRDLAARLSDLYLAHPTCLDFESWLWEHYQAELVFSPDTDPHYHLEFQDDLRA